MSIVILETAEGHLRDGFYWYEQQDPGAGEYFLRHMLSEIETLRDCAGMHRVIFGKHRLLTDIFPFGIYYTVRDDTVSVRAVLDLRRSPAWIRRQIRRA